MIFHYFHISEYRTHIVLVPKVTRLKDTKKAISSLIIFQMDDNYLPFFESFKGRVVACRDNSTRYNQIFALVSLLAVTIVDTPREYYPTIVIVIEYELSRAELAAWRGTREDYSLKSLLYFLFNRLQEIAAGIH